MKPPPTFNTQVTRQGTGQSWIPMDQEDVFPTANCIEYRKAFMPFGWFSLRWGRRSK